MEIAMVSAASSQDDFDLDGDRLREECGVFGIFADLALAIHIIMIFAGLVLLQATLTLPGIAGIVLTIGMAVDANVRIYERIREEVRAGRWWWEEPQSKECGLHVGPDGRLVRAAAGVSA